MREQKTVIGVTGPIASGKDTLCSYLKKAGADIIDADKIGRRLLEGDLRIKKALIKVFGDRISSERTGIDRGKLADIVFADKKELAKLDRIMHPRIKAEVIRDIRRSKSLAVIVNAAVLKEIGLSGSMDNMICVIAGKARRLRRLLKKMPKDKALSRMNSQRSERAYRDDADIVIRNDSSISAFKKKAERALRQIMGG